MSRNDHVLRRWRLFKQRFQVHGVFEEETEQTAGQVASPTSLMHMKGALLHGVLST